MKIVLSAIDHVRPIEITEITQITRTPHCHDIKMVDRPFWWISICAYVYHRLFILTISGPRRLGVWFVMQHSSAPSAKLSSKVLFAGAIADGRAGTSSKAQSLIYKYCESDKFNFTGFMRSKYSEVLCSPSWSRGGNQKPSTGVCEASQLVGCLYPHLCGQCAEGKNPTSQCHSRKHK